MNSRDKENEAKLEVEQAFQAFDKAVREKSPNAHLLATSSLSKLMGLFVAMQTVNYEEIVGLIKSFIMAQKENNQKTANALVKIVIVLLVIIVVLLVIIFKESMVSYFTNGIALYNRITPDQKFNLFYIIPGTVLLTWILSSLKNKK